MFTGLHNGLYPACAFSPHFSQELVPIFILVKLVTARIVTSILDIYFIRWWLQDHINFNLACWPLDLFSIIPQRGETRRDTFVSKLEPLILLERAARGIILAEDTRDIGYRMRHGSLPRTIEARTTLDRKYMAIPCHTHHRRYITGKRKRLERPWIQSSRLITEVIIHATRFSPDKTSSS